jgi:hypothetical protein
MIRKVVKAIRTRAAAKKSAKRSGRALKAATWRDPLIERWQNAERVLESMPQHERQHHWNMGFWGEKTSCGTIACAAGHCGLDPWFRRRGFKLDFAKRDNAPTISDVPAFFGFEGTQRIFLNQKRRSVETVLGEVRDYVGELQKIEKLTSGLSLPKIGEQWPQQGGIFAGARVGARGEADYLLVVGPEHDGFLNWNDAVAWAAQLVAGEHRDFALPTRSEGVALFSRAKSLFEPAWYWLSEQHAEFSFGAWFQGFGDGNQLSWHKGDSYRARAVRRVCI